MTGRHIEQLRRIGQLLRTLANDEEVHGDLDGAERLLYLSHHVHDVADTAEDHREPCREVPARR